MQVQKMLNMFLAIFVIINIVVFAYLYYLDQTEYTLSTDRVEHVKQVLESRQINIGCPIVTDYHPRARLAIREPEHNEAEVKSNLFDAEQPLIPSEEELKYVSGTASGGDLKELKVKLQEERGRVIYTDMNPSYESEDFNSLIANRQTVEQFVDAFTITDNNYELVDERKNDERAFILYYFNERYKEELIFSNEVKIKLEAIGITEATSMRYQVIGFQEDISEIYPPDEALFEFMSFVEENNMTDVTITDMDLGYHLGPDGLKDLGITEIEPHYRLKIASGQTYYINAYTNNVVIY